MSDQEPTSFDNFGLDKSLVKAVKAKGYVTPTAIQEQSIRFAMEGRDVMGAAQTGTGKTAAFGLPILHRLLQEKGPKLRVLILSPTRELAAQIDEALKAYAKFTKIRILPVYGGVAYGPQLDGFKTGVDILVATPGRLLDHMERGNVSLRGVRTVVLDEADRMMDMGFMPDIKRIFKQLPEKRQTMLYSATFPDPIVRLSKNILTNPERVQVGEITTSKDAISHTLYPVPAHLKPRLIAAILDEEGVSPVLIFTRTKHRADRLQKMLTKQGIRIIALHSNRTQSQRVAALQGFKSGKYEVMVATDIAARGIDIRGISHVINYDVPATPEDYIHRTGRTARADETGCAYTLMAPDEEILLNEIERHINKVMTRQALRDFDYSVAAPERKTALQTTSGQVGPTKKSFYSPSRRPVRRRKF